MNINKVSEKLFWCVLGAFIVTLVKDITSKIPYSIEILIILIISAVAIIIIIRKNWENLKKSRFIRILYKYESVIRIIFSIALSIFVCITLETSIDLFRIVFGLICIIFICAGICAILLDISYKSISFLSLMSIFLIIIFTMFLLSLTYIQDPFSRALNKITKLVIGKSVVPELYIYDRGFLGIYKSSGYGKKIFNGDVIEGFFVNNKLNGEGKLTFADGRVYEGFFVDNKLNGKGKLTFADGSVIEEFFVDYISNGEGKITFADGSVIEGIFEYDEIGNKVKIISQDGDVKTIIFKEGTFSIEDD